MNRQDLLQDKRQIWLRHSGTVSSIADETAGIAEMCRGTKGSNPPPSSGESGKLRPLRAENPGLSCRGTRSSNPSSSSRESNELRNRGGRRNPPLGAAVPTVRIHLSPAESQQTFGSARWPGTHPTRISAFSSAVLLPRGGTISSNPLPSSRESIANFIPRHNSSGSSAKPPIPSSPQRCGRQVCDPTP
jgi:hypothetical protein